MPTQTLALNHSPAQIVAQLLIDQGLADPLDADGQLDFDAAWPVTYSTQPPDKDQLLTVFEAAGVSHGRNMIDGSEARSWGVQVMIRGRGPGTAFAKANAIQTWMNETVYAANVTIDASTYNVQCFNEVGDPINIGEEETSEREVYTLNALVTLRKTAG